MNSMLTTSDLTAISRRTTILIRTSRRRSPLWRAARKLAMNCHDAADPSSLVHDISVRNVAECAAAMALVAWVKAVASC